MEGLKIIDKEENNRHILEINGVRYTPRERYEQPKSSKLPTMMAMMLCMSGGVPEMKTTKRPCVDVVKEFGLIQIKQSKLSRSDRDWVEHQFNLEYKRI